MEDFSNKLWVRGEWAGAPTTEFFGMVCVPSSMRCRFSFRYQISFHISIREGKTNFNDIKGIGGMDY